MYSKTSLIRTSDDSNILLNLNCMYAGLRTCSVCLDVCTCIRMYERFFFNFNNVRSDCYNNCNGFLLTSCGYPEEDVLDYQLR